MVKGRSRVEGTRKGQREGVEGRGREEGQRGRIVGKGKGKRES